MARGRLISKSLGSSRRFAALATEAGRLGEFAQTLYPLLVAHSDDFGRLSGDSFTVKHAVFPTSRRREQDFAAALGAMVKVGLIDGYTAEDGRLVIAIREFDTHQPGLSKRTNSRFPAPPVNFTEVQEIPSQYKGTELKRREGKRRETDQNLPPRAARRDSQAVEKSDETRRPEADRVPTTLRAVEDHPPERANDRRRGMEGQGIRHLGEVGLSSAEGRAVGPGDVGGGARPEADDRSASCGDAGEADTDAGADCAAGVTQSPAGGLGHRRQPHGEAPGGLERLRAIVASARTA
jgi:hypothetical protein